MSTYFSKKSTSIINLYLFPTILNLALFVGMILALGKSSRTSADFVQLANFTIATHVLMDFELSACFLLKSCNFFNFNYHAL